LFDREIMLTMFFIAPLEGGLFLQTCFYLQCNSPLSGLTEAMQFTNRSLIMAAMYKMYPTEFEKARCSQRLSLWILLQIE